MAVYKVPQDVEADDKLIGPFSFRQFIYLLIVAGAMGIAFFLSRLFIPLAIIPLPVIVFFGALALPLRKDQPMETYLAAMVSFYLKPRRRLWNPDGTQVLVQITAPKVAEVKRTKDLSQDEAEQRLSYLANIVDSRGWSVRGVDSQSPSTNSAMNSDVYFEAQQAPDVLDSSTGVGRSFDTRLGQADTKRHQEMLARVQKQASEPTAAPTVAQSAQVAPADIPTIQQTPQVTPPDPYTSLPSTPAQVAPDDPSQHVSFNPYPTAIHQSMLNPIDPNAPKQPQTDKSTSEKPVSADIMNLANNSDLSVETIAREANRIHEREKLSEDEVVISLR